MRCTTSTPVPQPSFSCASACASGSERSRSGNFVISRWAARADVDGAHREPYMALVEVAEVDQLIDAPLRRVAGDQRPVDGADGDSGDPAGCDPLGAQRLEHARLIRAERPAALKHEHAFV